MPTNSRELIRRLEQSGCVLKSVKGSHHKFWHPNTKRVVILPHPRKDLPIGTVRAIYRDAGWPFER